MQAFFISIDLDLDLLLTLTYNWRWPITDVSLIMTLTNYWLDLLLTLTYCWPWPIIDSEQLSTLTIIYYWPWPIVIDPDLLSLTLTDQVERGGGRTHDPSGLPRGLGKQVDTEQMDKVISAIMKTLNVVTC